MAIVAECLEDVFMMNWLKAVAGTLYVAFGKVGIERPPDELVEHFEQSDDENCDHGNGQSTHSPHLPIGGLEKVLIKNLGQVYHNIKILQ